jgi:hypothetical protein
LMISMTKAGFAVVHHLPTRMSHIDLTFYQTELHE